MKCPCCHHHYHRHHRQDDKDSEAYPPPGRYLGNPPPPLPPSDYADVNAPPPPFQPTTHVNHVSHETAPRDYSDYAPPPPPHAGGAFNYGYPPEGPSLPVPHISTSVHHVSQDEDDRPETHHGHRFQMPSFAHHVSHQGGSGELRNRPTVKVYSKAQPDYSLTIRDGKVILALSDPRDESQQWYKDEKYSTNVKDEEGRPCFSLVNKAFGLAMKHSVGESHPVQLVPYNPDILDESVLWTVSGDLGDGFRAMRMVNNVHLNVDAFRGNENSGGVHDGTLIVLWKWNKGDNQRWRIVPYYKPSEISKLFSHQVNLRRASDTLFHSTMEFPYGHHHYHRHHKQEDKDSEAYPSPGGNLGNPPPPLPPSYYADVNVPPPPFQPTTHVNHASHETPPRDYSDYATPPPPHAGGAFHYGYPPEGPPPPVPHISTSVHHVSQDEGVRHETRNGHRFQMPSFAHHLSHQGGSGELRNRPTVKVYSKAQPDYSLTIRDGKVILALSDPRDESQHWYKDEKYCTKVKDEEGRPCFSLVNKAFGLAMKHSVGESHLVQLVPYNPDILDESVLWTESRDLGDGFRAIRMVNNVHLNVDAFRGDKNSGGVHDGTLIVLWKWNEGDNQRWRIFPYCEFQLVTQV